MMNKTILMLSVSCMPFIAGADLCYAGFNPDDTPLSLSPALLKSHVSTHTSHLTAGHLSSLEDFNKGDNKLVQLAAACFVTDTTDCSGNEFAGNNADDDSGGVPPGGSGNGDGDGDDYELDNEDRCRREGYTETSCPEGYEPYNYCPYDNTYFQKCVSSCPSDYKECEEPYHGVGEACDGKYASCECTPCGAGYDNTTIPEGYVQDGEACLDCDGKTKYKIKPNSCDGYMDCGNMGPEIGAGTCQSGNETLYDNCKACPYECSLSSCPEPFTCTKEECSGMYCKTGCQSGYDWDAVTQSCTEQCASSYKYTCTGSYETGGSGDSCGGKYQSCTCTSGYEWKDGKCQEVLKPEWGKCNGSAKNCNIGDILYSDRTCSPQKISGKTPIAVVVYKSSDRNCAQAMALNSIGSYKWGRYATDISTLQNLNYDSEASRDLASCENTATIIAAGDKSTYPAAWAAHKYKTVGTEAGNWCLPASGIMNSIKNGIELINIGYGLVRGSKIEFDSYFWSSSECRYGGAAWTFYLSHTYGLDSDAKYDSLEVRPVIEF